MEKGDEQYLSVMILVFAVLVISCFSWLDSGKTKNELEYINEELGYISENMDVINDNIILTNENIDVLQDNIFYVINNTCT